MTPGFEGAVSLSWQPCCVNSLTDVNILTESRERPPTPREPRGLLGFLWTWASDGRTRTREATGGWNQVDVPAASSV